MGNRRVQVVIVVLGAVCVLGVGLWAGVREREQEVTIDQVPAAVREALLKEADGARIQEIERENEGGRTVYGAEWTVHGEEIEIELDEKGNVLGREAGDDEEDDDDDAAGDDEDDAVGDDDDDAVGDDEDDAVGDDEEENEMEEEISFDQLPDAVKAAISSAANGAKIEEIEKEKKDGVILFEAEWVEDGQEIEIQVSSDGQLLGREIEEDEND